MRDGSSRMTAEFQTPPLNLPISLDKIREGLSQPAPREPLKGLTAADATMTRMDFPRSRPCSMGAQNDWKLSRGGSGAWHPASRYAPTTTFVGRASQSNRRRPQSLLTEASASISGLRGVSTA